LYTDFDQVKIASADQAFPPPMSITGNNAQDRHVFFNGAVTSDPSQSACGEAGDLYETDSIVGNLRCVPAGDFTQGSPTNEPCRYEDEGPQFIHTLTRDLAVMETEVTRQMWSELKAAQPSLPNDPTDTDYGSGMANPAQNLSWYEAVLFANLLSLEQGLTRCYYTDASFTNPITASNYQTDTMYCNFSADGYRLPTEGEWEYFCRAGTNGPYYVNEPNYNSGSCDSSSCNHNRLPNLEDVAWFCANRYDPAGNNTSKPVGLKDANPWGLRDVHGNVYEWCWDWYSSTYPWGSATDYAGSGSGSYRAVRDGDWSDYARFCRSAVRSDFSPGSRYYYLGFRLLRSLPGE